MKKQITTQTLCILLFSSVFLQKKPLSLEQHPSSLAMAQTSQPYADSPLPKDLSLPIQKNRNRVLPFVFFPKKQQAIAITKKGNIFLNGRAASKKQIAQKFQKIKKNLLNPYPTALLLDKSLTVEQIWPLFQYLDKHKSFFPRTLEESSTPVSPFFFVVEVANQLQIPKVFYDERGNLLYHYTNKFFLYFGTFKPPLARRPHSNYPITTWWVRLEKRGYWLRSNNSYVHHGCELKKNILFKTLRKSTIKPTCTKQEGVVCIKKCIKKLKEIYPDQRNAFFYIDPKERKHTTLQLVAEFFIAFKEGADILPIWLLNPSLPIQQRYH